MQEDGRWITTKSGNRVFIKNKDINDYMNNKIRNKGKKTKEEKEQEFKENFTMKDEDYSSDYIMYQDFFGYQNVDKKNWLEKEKAVDLGDGMYSKQIAVYDNKTGENVGRLWYSEITQPDLYFVPNKIWVDKIEVHPNYRRKGIATQMYKELQRRAGDEEIYFGEATTPGKKLLENIATITKKKRAGKTDYYWGRINL